MAGSNGVDPLEKESVRKCQSSPTSKSRRRKVYAASTPPDDLAPKIEALVNDLIGRVADKWTMLVLEVLAEKG